MCVQLSLSLHFYLLYLLWNSCDVHDAFLRHSMLMRQSNLFSWKHQTLSCQIYVCQTVWLTTKFEDRFRYVCTLNNHMLQHQLLWPVSWSSTSLTHGHAYHKTSSTKHLVNGESSYVQAWRQNDITLNVCKAKIGSFQSQHTTQPALFRVSNRLPKKTRFASFALQLFKSK